MFFWADWENRCPIPHIVDMVKELKSLGSYVELITNGTLLTKSIFRSS